MTSSRCTCLRAADHPTPAGADNTDAASLTRWPIIVRDPECPFPHRVDSITFTPTDEQ